MPFKTWLPSIQMKSGNIIDKNPELEKDYPSYIVNEALSYDLNSFESVFEVNMMNSIPKKWQYRYYYYAIPKGKSFNKWIKTEKIEYLDAIKKHYNYSTKKAMEVLEVLTEDEIKEILNS